MEPADQNEINFETSLDPDYTPGMFDNEYISDKGWAEIKRLRAELEQARAEIERLKASYTVATWRCAYCGRTHPITASECGCYFERMKITTGSSTTQDGEA